MGTKQYMMLKQSARSLGLDTGNVFRVTNVEGFSIELCSVTLSDEPLEYQDLLVCGSYMDGGDQYDYIGIDLSVDVADEKGETLLIGNVKNIFHRTVCEGVSTFATSVGTVVRLVFGEESYCVPVQTVAEGWISIVAAGTPPGDIAYESVPSRYNVDITQQEGRRVDVLTGTKGYGNIVVNGYREKVGQIVGKTLYIFLPENGRVSALQQDSGDLLRKTLRDVWNAFQQLESGEVQHDAPPTLTREVLISEFGDWKRSLIDSLQESQTQIDLQIERVDAELRRLLVHKRANQRVIDVLRAKGAYEDTVSKRWSNEQTAAIRALEHVHQCSYILGAVQIETTELFVEHEGGIYRMGSYSIRISADGSIFVFQTRPAHPRGYIHPHVNSAAHPCLGNITQAVYDLVLGGDYALAFKLIIDLLMDGYDHSVASVKITEWPKVEVET